MTPASSDQELNDDAGPAHVGVKERLWTPWRMRYIGGGAREDGCVFCNRLAGDNDVASLILHRGDQAFAILNLFPYNTAHLMLVPNAHVASPEDAALEALAELALLLPPTLRALRRALGCHGFNVGLNVGAVAGAGVAEHLHQHVVPRWTGDANFMPIVASTMVLPELLPVTYAKVRAELERELRGWSESIGRRSMRRDKKPAVEGAPQPEPSDPPSQSRKIQIPPNQVAVVVLSPDLTSVLVVERDDRIWLPLVVPDDDEPLWRAASRMVGDLLGGADLVGWAGDTRAWIGGRWALTFLARESHPTPVRQNARFVEIGQKGPPTWGGDRTTIEFALANLAPSIASPSPT
jgi:ATP adenylyltransferase